MIEIYHWPIIVFGTDISLSSISFFLCNILVFFILLLHLHSFYLGCLWFIILLDISPVLNYAFDHQYFCYSVILEFISEIIPGFRLVSEKLSFRSFPLQDPFFLSQFLLVIEFVGMFLVTRRVWSWIKGLL